MWLSECSLGRQPALGRLLEPPHFRSGFLPPCCVVPGRWPLPSAADTGVELPVPGSAWHSPGCGHHWEGSRYV